jgi:hypothetical protein
VDLAEMAAMADPRARHLLGLWSSLSARHVALGGNCGCGFGGISVSLGDFERDIADYLYAEAERLGETGALALLCADGAPAEQEQPVRALLERLCEDGGDARAADWLLPRLARTLESFAKLHGPTGPQAG